MAEPFLGEVKMMSFGFAPRGWAPCNGQLLPINQNQALFSLLGTAYGGDGRTTFGLPNLQGRVPIHVGAGYNQGQAVGEPAHTLSAAEMPAHLHAVVANTSQASQQDGNLPAANKRVAASTAQNLYGPPTSLVTMNTNDIGFTGGSQPHENMQPYLTVMFCIALIGIFPSRN
ncbi:MAG: tail fiber protein [Actinomycetota bacterium]|nr:tail fiber protein [Actinomycetota bacterium]